MPAEYFTNFPLFGYTLNPSVAPGEVEYATDLFHRAAPIRNILKNKELFHEYVIRDGETPEMLADTYYGSSHYHWVVTLLNNILDPLLDWPKKYGDLIAFVNEKYGSIAVAQATIHHYTMTITKVDSAGYTSSETTIIDLDKYNSLVSLVPVVYTFAGGRTVTVTTTRSSVDSYTYEVDNNESKRVIQLLKSDYVPQVVSELERIMAI
jgi:hypothetical protein